MASITKKIWEKVSPVIGLIKAAKLFYTIFAMSVAYSGWSGYNDVSEYMAEPVAVESAAIVQEPVTQKDWLPIIDERVNKAIRQLKYDFHGGDK